MRSHWFVDFVFFLFRPKDRSCGTRNFGFHCDFFFFGKTFIVDFSNTHYAKWLHLKLDCFVSRSKKLVWWFDRLTLIMCVKKNNYVYEICSTLQFAHRFGVLMCIFVMDLHRFCAKIASVMDVNNSHRLCGSSMWQSGKKKMKLYLKILRICSQNFDGNFNNSDLMSFSCRIDLMKFPVFEQPQSMLRESSTFQYFCCQTKEYIFFSSNRLC